MTASYSADSLWWDGGFRSGGTLRVSGDGGVAVASSSEPAGSGDLVRRLPGTLLPGLVDAHVHAALVDLPTLRAGGLAGVWDLGGVPAQLAGLRGRPGMPRLRYAGPFLIPPGGYPSDRAWAPRGSWREIRSAADGAEAVEEVRAGGATLVKVTAHAGGPLLPQPTLAAVVAAAHDAGLPVVVHAEGPGTVAAAVEAGADWLAHTPWTEPLDAGLARECAARTGWISTLDIHGWGTPTAELGTAVANLRLFRSFGGRVRYGTDLGNGPLPPAINPREIRGLQAAGLTPDDVLAAMTEHTGVSWVPGGLDLDPDRFADVLATARVLSPGPDHRTPLRGSQQ
ncbi:amidohydrolase [Actinoplanes sp. M2I2]|uniref:amidohydrolase n=1 Tax=Actinoplanes sp. M2I2 TaxID=1734444 RepID=UPI002020FF34|nr:amidohydrolase [Actinoplanes sp. M2I2]